MYYNINIIINFKNMRQILSLSLPEQTTKELKKIAKQRGFDSVSSYVKYLFYLDKDLISETELLSSIKSARKEYKEGKIIKAKSLAELV
jgi:Arc/MetJ-type ribon-helix-helix transcriptional regulator